MVTAAGGEANDAIRLLISDKLENLVKLQVEAIQNLKIDKITVWDSGNDKDGNSSTANFVSSLMKSLPPIQDLLNMAGMELPDFLGKTANPVQVDSAAPSESEPSEHDLSLIHILIQFPPRFPTAPPGTGRCPPAS